MMSVDKRQKNARWKVTDDAGNTTTWDQVQVAVLMDLRDELQTLNRLLNCKHFVNMPATLNAIRRNTAKKRKRKPPARL